MLSRSWHGRAGRAVIKYIGSKRALIPWIVGTVDQIRQVEPIERVVDLFSGSARVGHALKTRGMWVTSNDINSYAHVLAQALVEADARQYSPEVIEPILAQLAATEPVHGWFTHDTCEAARYFQPRNGARIEAIRQVIEDRYSADPLLRSVLLTSLLLAADKVDSTTGVQMAYLKQWAPRAHNDLALHYPPLVAGAGQAVQGDAMEVAENLEGDLFYLDPPYNQHSYLGNYHVWETLVRWDQPSTYGVARKREDVRTRKSPFNSRREARISMEKLFGSIRSRNVMVSFSNEGFFLASELEEMLSGWGYVNRLTRSHQRYVGARIGIYNPAGQRVGQVSHTQNEEFLFVASQSRQVYQALLGASPTLPS